MRRRAILLGLAALFLSCPKREPQALENDSERLGYSIGYQVGSDFRRQRIELRSERVVEGALDALENQAPALTPAEMREALVELRRQAVEKGELPRTTD